MSGDDPGVGDRPGWQLIDHTGDTGILVRAPSREALHEIAARALFEILYDPATVRPKESWEVSVRAEDREDLMVRWLSELLFLHEAKSRVFREAELTRLGERELVATVRGEPLEPSRHRLRTALKAVTYHALLVSEDRPEPGRSPGWSARIIFDV